MNIKPSLLLLGGATISLVAFLSAPTSMGQAIHNTRIIGEARTPISSLPYIINQSGSYFVTRNLIGSSGQDGIQVAANGVTLDLNGFTLDGGAGSLNGIVAPITVQGVHVLNGTLRNWGSRGLNLGSAQESQLQDVSAFDNVGDGILVGDGFTVLRCRARGNQGSGISVGSSGLLRDCSARDNGVDGFTGVSDVTAITCQAAANMANGFQFLDYAIVDRCRTGNNGNSGVITNIRSLIKECSVHDNASQGLEFNFHSRALRNVVTDSGNWGIWAQEGDSWVEGNMVSNNAVADILLNDNSHLTIGNHIVSGVLNVSGGSVAPIQPASTATNPVANHN